jgi:periplasmic protein TonB
MELKKNPAKDIHRKSGMFFQIGLGISIVLMITAFEWRTEVTKVQLRKFDTPEDPLVLIPVTEFQKPEPLLPSPEKNEIVKAQSYTNLSPETTTESTVDPGPIVIDQTELPSVKIVFVTDSIEECLDCGILIFAEKQPEPLGGYESFYALVRNNLKYPKQAQRAEVQGKVFVEFVVNRDGTPTDIKVIKGIGAGCDEEAKRVIGLTKWNPGKQRGKPVRVKMVMPITFVLN